MQVSISLPQMARSPACASAWQRSLRLWTASFPTCTAPILSTHTKRFQIAGRIDMNKVQGQNPTIDKEVGIPIGGRILYGNLAVPDSARGVVLFAHGSGSSRYSPRNRYVARLLNSAGLATLLVDLLTPDEEARDERTAQLRFDIDLLAERLIGATDWLTAHPDTRALRIGYFGASTGAGRSEEHTSELQSQFHLVC